jgi:hypothetical protein
MRSHPRKELDAEPAVHEFFDCSDLLVIFRRVQEHRELIQVRSNRYHWSVSKSLIHFTTIVTNEPESAVAFKCKLTLCPFASSTASKIVIL